MKKLCKLKVDSEEWKVKFSSHCEDERREDAAIQIKSAGSPRAKASRLTKVGFTLAEVLITLVIIGVVAAITVPMLMNDTHDKQYVVGMQKARATIGEAFRLATINGEITKDIPNAKDFVTEVLAKKYLKISKQCDSATECGFSSNIKQPDGVIVTMPTKWSEATYAAILDNPPTADGLWGTMQNFESKYPNYDDSTFFQTLDGFSVNFFYNPYCVSSSKERYVHRNLELSENAYAQLSMDVVCFNAVYDMNGKKGPNTVGKDIGFVTTFYNNYNTSTVAVLPNKDVKQNITLPREANNYWKASFDYCANLDDNNWILPNLDELSSMYLNLMLIRGEKTVGHCSWARSLFPETTRYRYVCFGTSNGGHRSWLNYNNAIDYNYVRCVRNTALK